MIKRVVVAGLFLFVCSVSAASAGSIISGNGESWTSTLAAVCAQVGPPAAACGGTTVGIASHPAWMDQTLTNPLAAWVSYANTGYGGTVLAPRAGIAPNLTGQTPIIEITESFTGVAGGALAVRFWADDTLDIYFNGLLVKPAAFGQDTCANVPIGCQPGEFWDLNTTLTGGLDTIRMIAYQVGSGTDTTSNPFGVLDSGTYAEGVPVVTAAPEPATLMLLGLGAIGAGLRRVRRQGRSS